MDVAIIDLGSMPYRQAWALQEQAHEQVVAGEDERVFLVEHPPVITLGRRPGTDANLVAQRETLARMGVELVESDRGGNITFHGPGQITAYPIIRLNDHRLSVGAYVHRLEDIIIDTLTELGVPAGKDVCAVGVWTGGAKIAAIGVRVKRGVTLHGLALNVTTDMRYFDLIVPCGLRRPVTSVEKLMGADTPSIEHVKHVLGEKLHRLL